MAQVITLSDYRPTPRYDDPTPLAWTEARIEEGETADGPWVALETITLEPVDTDPAHPQLRNLTTELASDTPALWYRVVFLDASGDQAQPTAAVQNIQPTPSSRDLCALADVRRYIPGYVQNDETDDTFAALITSESESIHDETGREIIGYGDQPAARSFTLSYDHQRTRRLNVGDLASVGDTDITVELLATDDTTVETIDRAAYRPLYDGPLGLERQPTRPWEPVTALEFPRWLGAPTFTEGQTLLVTGNFGFPSVPVFIREACAKRVILRYASDVALAGTQAAAAIAEINLAGLFASARDDVERLQRKRPLTSPRLS